MIAVSALASEDGRRIVVVDPSVDESAVASSIRFFDHFFRVTLRCSLLLGMLLGALALAPVRSEAATTCSLATSAAAHILCWLDFTGYPGSGASAINLTMPDGSVLTGLITNNGTVSQATIATPVYGDSAFGGVALGDEDYLNILGKPAFYQNGIVGPIVLSALKLTDPQGRVISPVTIAGADDESLDQGDGVNGALHWMTTGSNWAILQLMPNTNNSTTASVCTLTGTGTQTAKCVPNGNTAPAAAYILTTALTSAQTVGMSSSSQSAQGFAFAIQLASLTASKTVAARETPSDQFTVAITRAGTAFATASTTGTGTAASVTSAVAPTDTYALTDTAASGTIAHYASTVACTNATAGSSTTLPASGASSRSVTIVPVNDDQISCAFTNTALTLTSTPVAATATYPYNMPETDLFTLKNTSTIAGTIAVTAPTVTSSTGSAVTPNSYTYNLNTYSTVAALNTAIAAAGPTAAGGSIVVGVTYTTNAATSSSTDTVALPATVTNGNGTSGAGMGTEVDTIDPLPSQTTGTNCYVATGSNKHLICWLDFAGYGGLGTESFSLKMPDGSTLAGTVSNTGLQTETTVPSPIYSPTPIAANTPAFGVGAYTGIAGSPIFVERQGGTGLQSPIVLSNLTLTDPNGHAVTTVGMVGADAETTIFLAQFNNLETLFWQGTGAAYTLLELMPAPVTTAQVCTLSALAQNVTCIGNSSTPVNAYLLRSILNTTTSGAAQTIGMSATTPFTQAWAFGIDLSLLTATKTVSTRVAPADQFTVQVARGVNGAPIPTPTGTPFAAASTSGTGTTATATTPYYVIPNEAYVWSESMAAGSHSALSQYATTVNCSNAMPTAGVTQVLPAANVSAQSVAVIPQPDAEITCAFTNVAVVMTNVAVTPAATDPAGTAETDKFTLTNTSAIAGTFAVGAPTITPFTGTTAGTAIAPTGYTLTVGTATTSYTTLAALNAAIAGMTATATNGSIVVGVTYTTTAGATTSDVVSLPATIASGTGTSAATTAAETDTLSSNVSLAIAKTGTTATSPGGLISYSILVTNNGPSPANGATFSDPMPTGVTVTGTPTCATTSGGAVCGAVAVSAGQPQTVTSTLGAFPSGSSLTFTIAANAAATCANATSPCTYTNTASVTAGTATQTSSLTTTVATANGLTKTVQNLSATGSAGAVGSANTAVPGDVLQYVLTFMNTTGQPIYGVTITDTIPANTTYYTGNAAVTCVVAQAGGPPPPCSATYTAGSALVTGALPSKASGGNPLLPGGTSTVTFQVKVN